MDNINYIDIIVTNVKGIVMRSSTVNVYDLIDGAYCVTIEDGGTLNEKLKEELQSKEAVKIDFNKTQIFASPFFRSSFGSIIKEIGLADFNKKIQIKNLSKSGQKLLEQIKLNITQVENSPIHQKRLNDILHEELAEI
ncbi:MAG: STAS-like domain-containing protein [Balneola sp.]